MKFKVDNYTASHFLEKMMAHKEIVFTRGNENPNNYCIVNKKEQELAQVICKEYFRLERVFKGNQSITGLLKMRDEEIKDLKERLRVMTELKHQETSNNLTLKTQIRNFKENWFYRLIWRYILKYSKTTETVASYDDKE